MNTRRLKAIVAKRACAIGECERHDDEITAFNLPNGCAHVFDHADSFVPHHATDVVAFHLLIGPQIASADARACNANDSISRLDDFRVANVLNPNVASLIHHRCTHHLSLVTFNPHSDLSEAMSNREAIFHIRLQ
jgi:hypothetical protein